jgi:hypothetical protein
MESVSHTEGWPQIQEDAAEPESVTEGMTANEAADAQDPSGAVLAERVIRIGVGVAALGVAALTEAVRRTLPTPVPTDELAEERTDPLGLVTGAALGLTLLVGERVATTVGGVARAVGPPVAWVAGVPPLGPAATWVRDVLTVLDQRWRDSRPQAEVVASAFAREVVPEVLDAVLDQLDLTWLVAERVDLDELVARVDLDAAVDRIDLDRVLARVDVDQIVRRVDLDAIVSRIDIDAVAAQIDVDTIASRVDMQAIVDRIDLVGLARYVVEEIDLPEIIRDSTGSMASETVRGVRMQGIEADEAVARVVDRVLLRHRPRRTDAPGDPEASDGSTPGEHDEGGPLA